MCLYCVPSCWLCSPLPGPSSAVCQVCEWMDSPGPPPLSLSLPSPTSPPHFSSGPSGPLVILCPVTHQCLRSFILSFTGKISESLIAIDLTNSSPPFLFTFPQHCLSWRHCLICISNPNPPASNLLCPQEDCFLFVKKMRARIVFWKDS